MLESVLPSLFLKKSIINKLNESAFLRFSKSRNSHADSNDALNEPD